MGSKKIKKKIKYKNWLIVLYQYDDKDIKPIESNIEAFDLSGKFLWRAENCLHGHYWEMQIDESNDTIDADDGGARHYVIELEKGRIIDDRIIK